MSVHLPIRFNKRGEIAVVRRGMADPARRLGHIQAEDCRRLWVAVLSAQVRLLLTGVEVAPSHKLPLAVHEARQWLHSGDFAEVCRLAGYDPDHVRSVLRAQLALPRRDRAIARIARFEGMME